ncbi:Dolichyl-phosphate-mannose-protein mannosyltransferase [Tritrichomonas foetus]|uniref:Dolichyl-phosphate-mannose-protein mannosyltransferase n=1 Tax=Tritrichomonas foetus TaxID=1144522 RepID=A0A1J4J501_9EUKA|nr:Dolichyl-phosphate-mannose-protein mannosyltransferase [Tritrichomonas foetus]|eukprot:OHS94392.1 Dolichyl-phosphate-mannose-protein mannosyltransferase [Tritrichomonas foetus]
MLGESKTNAFAALDTFLALALAFIAAYARLWTVAWPTIITFDEVHFGNFTKWYVVGDFHFDIHPPLGKLMMAHISKLGGYRGEIADFSKLGRQYHMNETAYISLRMIPAIFSSICSPLLYSCARLLYIDPFPAFASTLLVTFDISMIVESKFILSDGMLHFWFAFHLFTFCLFLRHGGEHRAILAGITIGCAGACKFTALSVYAIDGITQVIWILLRWPNIIKIITRGCALLIPSFIAMYLAWLWHFASTPYKGYHAHYMNAADIHTVLEREKINTSYWGNRVSDSPLLLRIIRWNIVMNRVNMRSKIPHPWESRPQYWPLLMDKYVLFHHGKENRRIHCMGLPASYWISTASLILTFPLLLCRRASWQNLLFVWSWAVSFIPFLGVPRTMFHYHYLLPLMCATLNTAALLHFMFKDNIKARSFACALIALLTFLCYLFFSPWAYGTKCPNCDQTRHWLSRWNRGPPKPVYDFGRQLFNTTKRYGKLPL